MNLKEIANQVIDTEIEGLLSLKNIIDDKFFKLIDIIYNSTGKIIVSGIGKSGIVARKIAATLSSTGTVSCFVHPSEASHGDLGIISKNDLVILLSNSGDTLELRDITYYCKRFGIFLVSIIRNEKSALAQDSDIALILPNIKEASEVCAPTTSTTMMMALGDVIATVLQVKRGFSTEDYHVFHPGGKLGSAFLRVENIMHIEDEMPLVELDTIMADALIIMTQKKFGCIGIIEGAKLIGIITDGDLRRHMSNNLLGMKVASVMTKNPLTISKKTLAAEALKIMNNYSRTNLFVVEDDNLPIGIIHIHDCLRAGIK